MREGRGGRFEICPLRTMNDELRKNGFTLIELLVVIAIIALLVVIAIPSARAIKSSYESSGAEAMISSAFAAHRAIAAKQHRYAGVRFQKAWRADNDGPQYMIFIVQDTNATGLVNGFRAVEGQKPMKLPDNLGVTDLTCSSGVNPSAWGCWTSPWSNAVISSEFRDATTFSIIFSPTGKLIIHDVHIRNRNGMTNDSSDDDIFNTKIMSLLL